MTTNTPFHERLARLEAQNAGSKGKGVKLSYHQRPDGLLVPVSTKEKMQLPWKSMSLAVVCLIALKGFLYAQFGEDQLNSRIAELSAGKPGAGVVAFVLRPDPVSGWAAAQMAPFVPRVDPVIASASD